MQNVAFYGVVKFKGFWLPFILLGINVMLGQGQEFPMACGILVGHAWYFLTILMPRGTGQTALKTPALCRRIAEALHMEGTNAATGRGGPAAAAAPPPAGQPGQTGFRSFSGGGQRLGTR